MNINEIFTVIIIPSIIFISLTLLMMRRGWLPGPFYDETIPGNGKQNANSDIPEPIDNPTTDTIDEAWYSDPLQYDTDFQAVLKKGDLPTPEPACSSWVEPEHPQLVHLR